MAVLNWVILYNNGQVKVGYSDVRYSDLHCTMSFFRSKVFNVRSFYSSVIAYNPTFWFPNFHFLNPLLARPFLALLLLSCWPGQSCKVGRWAFEQVRDICSHLKLEIKTKIVDGPPFCSISRFQSGNMVPEFIWHWLQSLLQY